MRNVENCLSILFLILSLAGPVVIFGLLVMEFIVRYPTVGMVLGAMLGAGVIRAIVLWVNRREGPAARA